MQCLAAQLGDDLPGVVLVGGAAPAVFGGGGEIRPTRDIDLLVDVTLPAYYGLLKRLKSRGFRECKEPGAPICRLESPTNVPVDLMPARGQVLGFSNDWYPEACATATPHRLPDGSSIRVVTPLCFAATKLEAFKDRGKGDFRSKDMEDLVLVLDSGALSLEQLANDAAPVGKYVRSQLRILSATRDFQDALFGCFPGDPEGQRRALALLDALRRLTQVASSSLAVLYRAHGVLAIDKPAGMLVIPGRGEGSTPSVRELLEAELQQKIYIVHRLDRDTSGVLLMALDADVHRALSMAFEAGRIEKRYLALVRGSVERALEISDALIPARRGRMRIARAGETGKVAHTLARPLERFARATLLEVTPLTGRTHQIRVHLSHVGHPLVVDPQYGRPAADELGLGHVLQRTPLHAARVDVPALPGLRPFSVEAPLAEDIAAALAILRA